MARILLAEDAESVREFVHRALEQRGHDVVAVEDGGAALERLAESEFDLVVADIVMPVMDGIALALKLGAERPDLPVLLMTGYVTEKQRAHNLGSLIAEVLSKPFTMDQLFAAVRRALAGKPAQD